MKEYPGDSKFYSDTYKDGKIQSVEHFDYQKGPDGKPVLGADGKPQLVASQDGAITKSHAMADPGDYAKTDPKTMDKITVDANVSGDAASRWKPAYGVG